MICRGERPCGKQCTPKDQPAGRMRGAARTRKRSEDGRGKAASRPNAKVKTTAKSVVGFICEPSRGGAAARRNENGGGHARKRLLGITQMRGPHIGPYPIDAFTMSVCRGDAVPHYSHAEPSDVRHFDELLERLMLNAEAQPEGNK